VIETDIKVTRIGKLWCCRLSINGKPWAQNWVKSRMFIGLACKDLMRWADKLTCGNEHTDWSRHRTLKDNERYCPDEYHKYWLVRGEWL